MMGLSGLGLDKELSTIMNANRANPAALQGKIAQQQRAGVTPQLLEVLASQKLLKEKQAAKTALMASQQQNPATIAQQQDQALRQGAMADLQNEMGVAKQVGMANNMKAQQRQKAMTNLQKMLTGGKKPRGIAGAPVPRPMKAAQGGIVGFQSGNQVEGIVEKLKSIILQSSNPQEKLQEMFTTFKEAEAADEDVSELLEAVGIIQQSPEFMEDATRSSLIGTMPPQPKERVSSNVLGRKVEDQRLMYDRLKNMTPAEQIKSDAVMASFMSKEGLSPIESLMKFTGAPRYALGTPKIRKLMNLDRFNQGGPVKYENGGIIDYIKENPFEAASLGLLVIPGLGLVNVGARIAYAGARYGIPAIARFLTSKPGMLTQFGIGTGVGAADHFLDLDKKFGADPADPPADIELEEVVVDGPKYDEPIGPKQPVTPPPVIPSGPTPDSPLLGLPSIPMIEKKPDYEPDALANLGTFLSSFGGGNPAAVAKKLRDKDFQRQLDVDEANLGIEQQNIANLLSEGELKFNFARLKEDTNLRKDLQLSKSKDALVQRLTTAAESRRKAEKDFEESALGINLSRQLLRAKNKLMTEGKGEQEYTLIKEQYDKVKKAYLSVYDGQIAAIQERLDALDINLDQKPVQIN